MSDQEIGFKEVSEVHRGEKRSKILTKLPYHFFDLAEEHLGTLREQYAETAGNPSSTDALVLHDNIKKIDKRLCQIYDLRERKITLAAINGRMGSQAPKDMTQKELAMYDEIVQILKLYRECGSEVPVEKQTTIMQPAPVKEIVPQSKEEDMADIKEEAPTCLVRVLEEVPPFVDVDQTYILKKEDVVTLPEKFARILSLKGAVKILDI
ncbi:MAG: DNA replication complex GINS family protein [Thermoplasmata archaeon]|nr:DNA replication complex GINS family protein [Thermoplasmata archaeon]